MKLRAFNITLFLGVLLTSWLGAQASAQCFLGILDDGPEGMIRGGGPHEVVFDGDYLFTGSPWESAPFGGRGMVRIYERDGDNWNLAWKLPPPDPSNADRFGHAIQPIGPEPHLLVGDPRASIVWELRLEQGAWKVVREMRPPDDGIFGFGDAIVYDGETLAIGASSSDIVYIYTRQNDAWALERRAKPQAGLNARDFGHSLALDGNRLLIGARSGDAVELWVRGGFNWVRSATLHHPDPENASFFGYAVAFYRGLAIVSDPGQSNGAAYIYRLQGGVGWVNDDVLQPWDTEENDRAYFGWDIVTDDDTILIQAQHALDSNGATYVFREDEDMGWNPLYKITPQTPSRHMDAGTIALQGDLLAVGGVSSLEGLAPVELFSLRPRCLCIADFNEDGRINPSDVTAFLNAWNARDPAADANADGLINTQDVAWFLLEWNTREHCIS